LHRTFVIVELLRLELGALPNGLHLLKREISGLVPKHQRLVFFVRLNRNWTPEVLLRVWYQFAHGLLCTLDDKDFVGSLNDLSPTNLLLVAGKLRVELLYGRLSNVFVLLYHHELLVDVETTIGVMQVC
jgi:hypothetical protein